MYAPNSPEWVLVEQACNARGFVTVPLYDTLGPDASQYIINETQLSIIFCSKSRLEQAVDISVNNNKDNNDAACVTYIIQLENATPLVSAVEVIYFSVGDIQCILTLTCVLSRRRVVRT